MKIYLSYWLRYKRRTIKNFDNERKKKHFFPTSAIDHHLAATTVEFHMTSRVPCKRWIELSFYESFVRSTTCYQGRGSSSQSTLSHLSFSHVVPWCRERQVISIAVCRKYLRDHLKPVKWNEKTGKKWPRNFKLLFSWYHTHSPELIHLMLFRFIRESLWILKETL